MLSNYSYQKIWKVSLPIIFSIVAENIVNVTDTAFLGRLGIIELGAAGNAGIFFLVLLEIGLGVSIGSQIIIGRRNGEGNFKQIGSVVHNAIFILIPTAIILFLFVQYLSPTLLALVTQSNEILDASILFLKYRSFGILFAFCNFTFVAFYTGITSTRVLTITTFIQAGINVIFDYLLIFGHFGFPEMGIKGAAIASVIAEISALIFFIAYTKLKVDNSKYMLFQSISFQVKQLKKMLNISLPIVFQYFMAVSAWLAFFMIIEQIGERELAISHIVRSIYMVLMIPLFGFSSATSTLVSNLIGEGKFDKVHLLTKRIVVLSLACALCFAPLVLIFSDQVIAIYTNDLSLIEGTKPILYIISASMFFFCIAYISFSAVTGTGKTQVALLIEIISIGIYLIGAYYLSVHFKHALNIVWCSEFVYFSLMGLLAILYLKYGNWKSAEI